MDQIKTDRLVEASAESATTMKSLDERLNDRDAELLRLVGLGLSRARIGVLMGVTKNTVIGRIDRLRRRVRRGSRAIYGRPPKPKPILECPTCHNPFEGRHPEQKFCSHHCFHEFRPPTSMDRLDAFHRKMDEVMALPVKRVPL